MQAAEIALGGGFWGTQYHPEYDLNEIATVMLRYGNRLLEDGTFPSPQARDRTVAELRELNRNPGRSGLATRHGLDASVLDAASRHRELSNWLACKVGPLAAAKTRA